MANSYLGAVEVKTASKSLAGLTYTYTLTCKSTLSTVALGTVTQNFQVYFYDECKDTVLTPPSFKDMTTMIYFYSDTPVIPASSSLNCGGFTYSIYTPFTANWPQIDL
jgi:hypothetical protein